MERRKFPVIFCHLILYKGQKELTKEDRQDVGQDGGKGPGSS